MHTPGASPPLLLLAWALLACSALAPVVRAEEFEVDLVVATFSMPDLRFIEAERERLERQLQHLTTDQLQPLHRGIRPEDRRYRIKHYFVLCRNSLPELIAPDILQMNCTETYTRLFEKTMAWWKAALHLEPRARFYVKRDMDTLPCWKLVLRSLDEQYLLGHKDIYAGAMTYNSPVHHNPGHRWHDEFFHELAPRQAAYWPYNQGAFYGLSASLLRRVMLNKAHLQPIFMEDAMVGGWVLPFAKHNVNWPIDHSCSCNRGATLYHHCKRDTQFDRCFMQEYSRCLAPDPAADIHAAKRALLGDQTPPRPQ